MNIYEKLQEMRCELQKKELKKTGQNKFVGYEYYELKDFMPEINELMREYKVTSVLTYGIKYAKLVIVNSEKPEETIIFRSPMSEANLKGTHAVQNLGAVETYLRRYLYITAFEIVENDALDATHDKEAENTPQATAETNLGNCAKCGAPNKLSQAGKRYCSALCWKNNPQVVTGNKLDEEDRSDDELTDLDALPF